MDGKSPSVAHDPFSDSARQSIRSDPYYSWDSANAQPRAKRRFESYRLTTEYGMLWEHDHRLKRTRVGNYIIWGFIALGLLVRAYINFLAATNVPKYQVQ